MILSRWTPRAAFAAALLALAPPAWSQPAGGPAAADYSVNSHWLCLPGRADPCAEPLPAVVLSQAGYGAAEVSRPAARPALDCFVVLPTVSRDQGMNSDLVAGAEERHSVRTQFARLGTACRLFVPIYRQMTVGAVAAAAAGANVAGPAELAYRDVAAAWREFVGRRSNGRPFVLVGHSQGSLMLNQLIAREVERDPALLRRMQLAILPGFNVLVPQGKTVGGTFQRTPLCTAPGQRNCVISWVSFREGNPPPPGALFGFADTPGMTVACVNPGRPGARGWVPLSSFFFARSGQPVPGGPISWSSEGPPPAPFLRTPGLVSARCVNSGPRGYLEVRTHADPAGRRTARIGGEVGVLGMFLPGWGMHLADLSIALGDLAHHIEEAGRP